MEPGVYNEKRFYFGTVKGADTDYSGSIRFTDHLPDSVSGSGIGICRSDYSNQSRLVAYGLYTGNVLNVPDLSGSQFDSVRSEHYRLSERSRKVSLVKLNAVGVEILPAGCKVVREDHSYVEVLREDGKFKVYLDKREDGDGLNSLLNRVRLNAPPEVVVSAVAMVRGFQIGGSYARKCLPEFEEQFKRTLMETLKKAMPEQYTMKQIEF